MSSGSVGDFEQRRAADATPPGGLDVAPGGVVGVLGGGQLGRMFVQAAQAMGYGTVVLDPDPASPAGLVAHRHLCADYVDPSALAELAEVADAVTTEFENVPAEALRTLAGRRHVAPAADAVSVCQDRAAEKAHFLACGVACAPHLVLASSEDLQGVTADLLPGVLKTARLGYDGKGQVTVRTRDELANAWAALGHGRCVLEQRLSLACEVSVVLARGDDGSVVHLPLQQNLHVDGVLAVTQVPAPDVDDALAAQAVARATSIAAALDYVGVLCVEFFVLADGSLVANEMAPRPHNSGHHSIDSCDQSQFDLQLRTLVGAPLVPPRAHSAAVMLNLLGDLWAGSAPDWAAVLALPGTHLHLYGKASARPGRKMGHLTVTAATFADARHVALRAAALLGLPAF